MENNIQKTGIVDHFDGNWLKCKLIKKDGTEGRIVTVYASSMSTITKTTK